MYQRLSEYLCWLAIKRMGFVVSLIEPIHNQQALLSQLKADKISWFLIENYYFVSWCQEERRSNETFFALKIENKSRISQFLYSGKK